MTGLPTPQPWSLVVHHCAGCSISITLDSDLNDSFCFRAQNLIHKKQSVDQRFPKWVPRNPRVAWTNPKGSTSYTFQFYARTADMSFNSLGVWQPLYRLIQLAIWLLLWCIILFTVRNLNNGNLGEKKAFMFTWEFW